MFHLFIFLISFTWVAPSRAEIIETEFTSGGHSFRAEGISQFKYPFLAVESENLLIVTHASVYWDQKEATWKGIKPLVDAFRNKNWPLKYLVSIQEKALFGSISDGTSFFPGSYETRDFYPYQGDSHRIVFKGKNLVMSGGNFTICACNATRSIIALSEGHNLNVYFAMDAMYEGELGTLRTLKDISSERTDKKFMQYLVDVFFNEDGLPCKEPGLYALDRNFQYKIFRNGRYIGQYGSGETKVRMNFEDSNKILKSLRP